MPTKTKPKQRRHSAPIRTDVSKDDQAEMVRCVGIDHFTEAGKATQFVAAVNAALAVGWSTKLRSEDQPLPAHIAAVFEPIAKKSAELAELLHPLRLPVELRHMEIAINDTAYQSVMEINAAAELIIALQRKQESRGAHRKISAKALEGALEYLGRIFDSFAADSSSEDRIEFLERCRQYLPRVK